MGIEWEAGLHSFTGVRAPSGQGTEEALNKYLLNASGMLGKNT